MLETARTLAREAREELERDILPYWAERMADPVHGGFYGRIDGHDTLHPDAPKGAILNARILWTFAAAYRLLRKPEYLDTATRAKRYLIDRFYDPECGGVYWSLNADGSPLDTKKQIYALGFAIYGLSEYARATADPEALDYAVRLFRDIEQHSFDRKRNGYIEAFIHDWQPIADMRLSDKDANTRKTMNTHLHILEPYANLYRVWPDPQLEAQLRNLIDLFTTRITDPATHHLALFFDDDWHVQGDAISYGHDIEASWLIHEAALVLGDAALLRQIEPAVVRIARAADEGLNPDGSMVYERFPSRDHTDRELHWWVQAENVVGHANLYQHFADVAALDVAARCWSFIRTRLIDREHGEWHWSLLPDGTVNRRDDKAGFWKCPYHNGRMCMELIERFDG